MTPIDGPLDYHRYPPRDRRNPRAAAPRRNAPAHNATPPTPHTPVPHTAMPHTEHVRNARRAPHPRAANDDAQQLHLRLDPADIPERHTPPQQRGKARRKRHRSTPAGPPWWKRARRFCGVLVFIGIAEVIAATLTAQDFQVHDVTVSGLKVTRADAVEPVVKNLIGQNWVRANTKDVVQAIEALPAVHTAHVERTLQWPLQLTLRIEERRPFARVGAGNEWWVVDENGVPFRRARKDDDRLYAVHSKALEPRLGEALPKTAWQPVVTFARVLSQDGSTPDGSTPDANNADETTVNENVQQAETHDRSTPGRHGRQWALRRIYFDEDGFASLRLEGGAHDELLVRLGDDRWPEKLQRAHETLQWFERTGSRASELNLVSYNMPVWTPRTSSGEEESGDADAQTGANSREPKREDGSLSDTEPSSSKPSSREG